MSDKGSVSFEKCLSKVLKLLWLYKYPFILFANLFVTKPYQSDGFGTCQEMRETLLTVEPVSLCSVAALQSTLSRIMTNSKSKLRTLDSN